MITSLVGLQNGYTMINEGFVEVLTRPLSPPVILSVPHDQNYWEVAFERLFKKRERGSGLRDWRVSDIARGIALGSQQASMVRGMFPRGYVDYNRDIEDPEEPAIADERLLSVYEAYHAWLHKLILESKRDNGPNTVLLDLHGFRNQPVYAPEEGYDVILGTQYGSTIHHGEPEKSLAEALMGAGFSVFLPNGGPVREGIEDHLPGKYTVTHYSKAYNLNAIQVEIARKFRSKNAIRNGMGLLEETFVKWIKENF